MQSALKQKTDFTNVENGNRSSEDAQWLEWFKAAVVLPSCAYLNGTRVYARPRIAAQAGQEGKKRTDAAQHTSGAASVPTDAVGSILLVKSQRRKTVPAAGGGRMSM
ncbi:hypothetical protein CBL_08034 [Carabus blaptoides fortunei]